MSDIGCGTDAAEVLRHLRRGTGLAALAAAMQEGVVLLAPDGTVLGASDSARRLLEGVLPAHGSTGPVGWACTDVDGEPLAEHPAAVCVRTGLEQRDRIVGIASTAGPRWLNVNVEPIRDAASAVTAVLCTLVEVAPPGPACTVLGEEVAEVQRRITQDALRQAEERFRLAFDMAPTGNAIILPDGRFVRINAQLASMLGTRDVDLLGCVVRDLVRDEDRPRLSGMLGDVLAGDGPGRVELRLSHASGRPVHAYMTTSLVHDATGAPAYIIAQVEDITARKLAQAALTHQATHDALTALPNRTLLLDRLGHALERSRRSQTHVALLFCDVDRFKRVNDSLGHEAGDLLLIEVARRLRTSIRGSDTAGRLSGDEFLVICEELAHPEDALVLAERVKAITDEPIQVGDQSIAVSLSIGVAHAGPDDVPSALLRRADTAMYEAKERGRGRFEVFDERLRDRALSRLQVESELREAVVGDQLRLFHQPIVDLVDGFVVGREALVRWQHPARGLLAPASFLDVAEESDLIVDLGSWVLDEACVQGRAMSVLLPGSHMAINVSARQLGRQDFRGRVEAALAASGLSHADLVLELTETSLLRASASTLADVEAMSRDGVRLAVDDFGTGYSSLTYLQRLPVKVVKIDRSFVADITKDPKRRAIAKAVIGLGQALDLEVIAEGVETAEQAAVLADMGCTLAQGFLFGRPAPMNPAPATMASVRATSA